MEVGAEQEGSPSLRKRIVNWNKVRVMAELDVGYGTWIIRLKTGSGHTDCCFLDGKLVRTEERKVENRI